MRRLLLAFSLYGCQAYDAAETTITSHGAVYVCVVADSVTCGDEFCWDGGQDELESILGTTCRPIGLSDRIWPALVGCTYACDGSLGCNATCGCVCP